MNQSNENQSNENQFKENQSKENQSNENQSKENQSKESQSNENQFNLLPAEIIKFIFNKVYLNDLINLRIVDRRFKKICDQFQIKQLFTSDYNN